MSFMLVELLDSSFNALLLVEDIVEDIVHIFVHFDEYFGDNLVELLCKLVESFADFEDFVDLIVIFDNFGYFD